MKDVFLLDRMLTPKLITFVYWLALLAALIFGVGIMFRAEGAEAFSTGLLTIIAGSLGARISCELLIVLFRMNEALQDLRKT
ncbi:MAG: DUF4282 domain-containing protein [Gammaproteobacteria bacterium]|nr:DUF4282 domain-containing protein [Gammaproteobacteria bacterium]